MEVHLEPSQELQLNELAEKTVPGTDELVQEAVARLLAHGEWSGCFDLEPCAMGEGLPFALEWSHDSACGRVW